MRTVELLSPAGDREKLEMALAYGADAVYMAGKSYGLRMGAGNFAPDELREAIALAHRKGARAYVTVNTVPRERELDGIGEFCALCEDCGADALILSDAGVLSIAKRRAPSVAVHMSTQAGITNSASAELWHSLGAQRVILARELSVEEIAEIRAHVPAELELEVFIHGAMCVSFSGRCLLSDYMTGREGNRGECAQPCRWRYALMQSEKPGEFFEVEEHAEGSYILNSRDLCGIEQIGALVTAGVDSLKIEGRSKSAYYAGAVTSVYRRALDDCLAGKTVDPALLEELDRVSHRPYCTGFLVPVNGTRQFYQESRYVRDWEVCAIVEESDGASVTVAMKNPFRVGELLELLCPGGAPREVRVEKIWELDELGEETAVDAAMRNQRRYRILLDGAPRYSMLRKPKKD